MGNRNRRRKRKPNPKREGRRPDLVGRAILRRDGDWLHILHPDGGDKPKKVRLQAKTQKPAAPHGSHQNGRHKQG
jgi:hypothetical protein